MSDLDIEVSEELEREKIEDPSEREDEEAPTNVRYAITSYGADYPVDSLVKRVNSEAIVIPKFQRGFVWTYGQASRFIESLLLGLPVPGIFLSRDSHSQKLLVIDGQQRLESVRSFYEGIIRGREFKLRGVRQDLEGLTYKTLEEGDRERLDDQIIHATIIQQDQPEDDYSSIFMVFERLNTGGTPLSSQEIRTSVFHGGFCDLIKSLNGFQAWRNLYGPLSSRLKDEELILRFYALYFDLGKYHRPMKVFLSEFMESNQDLETISGEDLKSLFMSTVDFVNQNLGPEGLRPEGSLNVAVAEAILVATASRLSMGIIENTGQYVEAAKALLENSEFLDKCKKSTTDEENVKGRIRIARQAFEDL